MIRERRFKIGANIDIEGLGLDDKVKTENQSETYSENSEKDEALGDIFDPFKKTTGKEAGAISQDGTVETAPEDDIVTSMAKQGERRVNWSLMVSMIFVFSLLSVVAGTAFPPIVSLVLLLILAIARFALGERWVSEHNLHLL